MVSLYVGGEKVGSLADGGKLLVEFVAKKVPLEFRDDSGELVGRLTPVQAPVPKEPLVPWDPTITQQDLDRIAQEPGFTFDEVKKKLGWQ